MKFNDDFHVRSLIRRLGCANRWNAKRRKFKWWKYLKKLNEISMKFNDDFHVRSLIRRFSWANRRNEWIWRKWKSLFIQPLPLPCNRQRVNDKSSEILEKRSWLFVQLISEILENEGGAVINVGVHYQVKISSRWNSQNFTFWQQLIAFRWNWTAFRRKTALTVAVTTYPLFSKVATSWLPT